MQQTRCLLKNQPMSAKKVRLAANIVRGKSIDCAYRMLKFSVNKSAAIVLKALESATANAENNYGLDIDALYISEIYVNEGVTAKRFRARAKGRGDRILKRSCHVTVIVSEK